MGTTRRFLSCPPLVNLDQLALFRLKRLLKGQCVPVTGDLMVIVIGRCCVRGMGSSTPLWHIEVILVLTNATSGLYPLFHRALSKDLVSFASWMREKLEASAHASTRSHCSHSAHSPKQYCAS